MNLAKLPLKEAKERLLSVAEGESLLVRLWHRLESRTLLELGATRPWAWDGIVAITIALIYGTAVALVLAALFGIDYLYRHFA